MVAQLSAGVWHGAVCHVAAGLGNSRVKSRSWIDARMAAARALFCFCLRSLFGEDVQMLLDMDRANSPNCIQVSDAAMALLSSRPGVFTPACKVNGQGRQIQMHAWTPEVSRSLCRHSAASVAEVHNMSATQAQAACFCLSTGWPCCCRHATCCRTDVCCMLLLSKCTCVSRCQAQRRSSNSMQHSQQAWPAAAVSSSRVRRMRWCRQAVWCNNNSSSSGGGRS